MRHRTRSFFLSRLSLSSLAPLAPLLIRGALRRRGCRTSHDAADDVCHWPGHGRRQAGIENRIDILDCCLQVEGGRAPV
ncbi:uncharacterized protein SCHCODRAFT_02630660 [Schizophyllum commune H4-8]|uniref:uncharacterized protein n=1 Tax=Schizophyllum commune (strain H4-8 / FGSC 9210) TaxID=578458 RepID=UPI00215E79A0|nr:uncharacterized protein SCHCODRAFT_02630660 [Schizophyllum commune H4-8]KAI5890025.1 hypothetical protein SCHCODRAFT_02630660 [Schizophyllum commune H4-8]